MTFSGTIKYIRKAAYWSYATVSRASSLYSDSVSCVLDDAVRAYHENISDISRQEREMIALQ